MTKDEINQGTYTKSHRGQQVGPYQCLSLLNFPALLFMVGEDLSTRNNVFSEFDHCGRVFPRQRRWDDCRPLTPNSTDPPVTPVSCSLPVTAAMGKPCWERSPVHPALNVIGHPTQTRTSKAKAYVHVHLFLDLMSSVMDTNHERLLHIGNRLSLAAGEVGRGMGIPELSVI